MALLELEVAEGLLKITAPKRVAIETEPKATGDPSERTETRTNKRQKTEVQATTRSLELW